MKLSDQRAEFLQRTETGAITDAMNIAKVSGWMEHLLPPIPQIKFSGRAFTVQLGQVRDDRPAPHFFEMLDQLAPGDVVVVNSPTPESVVGENILCRMCSRGGVGMVLDGHLRDARVIAADQLPICSRGPAIRVAIDYKIVAMQVPVLCDGIWVRPGDYITADADGVIVLPQERVDDVIRQAEWVAEVELEMDRAIKQGVPSEELVKISGKKKSPRQE